MAQTFPHDDSTLMTQQRAVLNIDASTAATPFASTERYLLSRFEWELESKPDLRFDSDQLDAALAARVITLDTKVRPTDTTSFLSIRRLTRGSLGDIASLRTPRPSVDEDSGFLTKERSFSTKSSNGMFSFYEEDDFEREVNTRQRSVTVCEKYSPQN